MHKAILGLTLMLLGGCAGDDLNMLAVSACQNSSNCTVTDTRAWRVARNSNGPSPRKTSSDRIDPRRVPAQAVAQERGAIDARWTPRTLNGISD